MLITPLQHYSCHHQTPSSKFESDQADHREPSKFTFMEGRIQWSKYRSQYANFANGLANQLGSGAQGVPFGIFDDWRESLKMPFVIDRPNRHNLYTIVTFTNN